MLADVAPATFFAAPSDPAVLADTTTAAFLALPLQSTVLAATAAAALPAVSPDAIVLAVAGALEVALALLAVAPLDIVLTLAVFAQQLRIRGVTFLHLCRHLILNNRRHATLTQSTVGCGA